MQPSRQTLPVGFAGDKFLIRTVASELRLAPTGYVVVSITNDDGLSVEKLGSVIMQGMAMLALLEQVES